MNRHSRKHRKRLSQIRRRHAAATRPLASSPGPVEALESRIALTGSPLAFDIHASGASQPSDFVQVGNTTFFVAEDATSGRELWKTDGTIAGTARVADIATGSASSSPSQLTAFQGSLLFAADDGVNGVELWISDGSEAGTTLVSDIFAGQTSSSEPRSSSPTSITPVGSVAYFQATSSDGTELWVTDGTDSGTNLVLDIATGTITDGSETIPRSSTPMELIDVNGQLFFTADDGVLGRELWTSDGTAAGTSLVVDLFPGSFQDTNDETQPNASSPSQLTLLEGELLFVATDSTNGTELWKSDGTAAGTQIVLDINPGTASGLSTDNGMIVANQMLLFAANDGSDGTELWKTDGTAAGTQQVLDIQAGTAGSLSQTTFVTAGAATYFAADDGLNGSELWRTDGTEAGTMLAADIHGATDGSGSAPGDFLAVGDRIFFTADDGSVGRELWESDGTAAGTQLVTDIAPGSAGANINQLFNADGILLFAADDGNGSDLWAVDSTDDPVAVPAAIDLLAVADTGSQDDDDITFRNNADADSTLVFQVTGVLNGALVRIYNGDTLIGSASAFETAATITTDGTTLLADGLQSFHATQTVNDRASLRSAEFQVTIDATAPGAISNTPSDTAQVGQAYGFDAESPDEGTSGVLYALSGEPSGMTIDPQSGQVTWTPTESQAGPQSFSIDVTDVAGNSVTLDMNLTVLAALAALPDTYTVAEDDTLNVTADGGVLANDDGAAQSVVVVDTTTNGTLTLNADGSFTYVPDPNFEGTDTFTYQANDGSQDSNVATVTIDVTAENDPPTVADDTYLATEDTTLTANVDQGVLANDSDLDGDTLTATLATQATNGTVTLNADGSFTYTPDADFTGQDAFFYTVSDGTVTSELVEATIQVAAADDVPTAAADSYTLNEDEPLTVDAAAGLLANDIDPDGDTLTATIVSQPANGTLTSQDDGSFVYTPAENFQGEDTFTYTVSDGTSTSAEATVTLTVTSINDTPVATDDTFTAASDGTTRTLDVLANDEDVEGSVTLTEVSSGSQGGSISIEGNQISYAAAPGFLGAETFTYTIEDADGASATATVTVNVADATAVNHVSGIVYLDHDASGSRDGGEAGVPGVQIVLTGEDTAGVSVSRTTITRNDGSYQFTDVPAGTYTLTQIQPAALVDGTSSTNDAGATADGNVISNLSVAGNSENNNFGESQLRAAYHTIVWFFAKQRYPQSSGDVFREVVAIAEEDAGNFDLARAIRAGETEGGGGPGDAMTPVANADTYTATMDQTLTVTVSTGVLANDTDPNGDALTASVVTTTSNGTLDLAADGSFTYQPDASFVGTDTFTYTASDGTNTSSTATVTITVEDDSTNTAPVAVVETFSVDEDQTLTVDAAAGVLNNDTDADGDNLTAILRTTTSNGTLNLATDGSFTYVPNANFHGTDSFAYVANDGTADSNEVIVAITVNSINDAPVAMDDTFSMSEDGSLARSAQAGVLANDSDPDGDTLTASLVDGPSSGDLTFEDDGSFSYSPAPDFHGDVTFTYEVSDGESTAQATATISVAPVDDAPVAMDDSFTLDEDTTLAIDAAMSILANDTDADGDMLVAVLVDDVANGTLNLNSDGTFTYSPDANFFGTDTFTYRAQDGTLDSALATVTLEVTDIDDPGRIILPAEFSDPNNIPTRTVGETFEVDVDIDDIDDDDYTYMLDLEASGIPEGAALPTIHPTTGVITWTPTAAGRFAIRVIAVNGDREADQETFLVDILASDVDTEA